MIKQRNFSTICIVAGSPSNDLRAARLMKQIKKQSPETNFIGIGGPNMQAEGLSSQNNFGDVNQLIDKPFFPLKNFLRTYIKNPWHPLMASLHYKNKQVVKKLENNDFYQNLALHKPSAFLTVGNEFLAKDIYSMLNKYYELQDQVKPPCILYERFAHNQRNEFKFYLDHFLYTAPKEQVNWRSAVFPSTNVGQEGVFRAYHYLYSTNDHFRQYLTENTIPILDEYHQDIMEKLIKDERIEFRKIHNLKEDQYVFFLAPGNTKVEVEKNLDLFEKAIKHFIQKTGQNKENFAVVISLQEKMQIKEMPIKVILAENENQKFSGMAGCDMGIAVNGEIVNEFAAFQLPTVVINEVGFFQAYFTLLYNQFDSDLNICVNGMAYPELMACKFGDAFPEKLSDFIQDFQKQPKTRYVMANKMNPILKKMTPIHDEQAQKKDVTNQENQYHNCIRPDLLTAQTVLQAAQKYESLNHNIKRYQIENERNQMLESLQWN